MERNMQSRPAVSELYELDGRQFWMPIPPRYKELYDGIHALRIKKVEDEDEKRVVAYRSLIGVVPEACDSWLEIEDIAECLSRLNTGQLGAIKRMCCEFELAYRDVGQFFDFMAVAKGMARQEVREKGIPVADQSEKGAQ